MTVSVAESYRCCAAIARRAASNFYWSFWLLPPQKRRAMCALYAFSRHTDDLGDSDAATEERALALDDWREKLVGALNGDGGHPILPALVHTVQHYSIPTRFLFEIIEGVQLDLSPIAFETFADLRAYCRLVASAVGLACLHIWGFRSEEAYQPAIECGVAFQLTNILRDLREDAERGRVYLPREDLRRFDFPVEGLRQGRCDGAFRELMTFELDRTEQCFERGRATRDFLSHDGRRSFDLMFRTYYRLFEEIRRRGGDVFTRRVRLAWPQKLSIAAGWCLSRWANGSPAPPSPAPPSSVTRRP